ncbi:CoA transferase [Sphingobium sp. V4]|uniref:CoA transferase n=1 Tax=Sphingobium sp. V4 TaxID=3038927 RepID=UPI002557D23B|nr:CoA transferase [Sphingobium sp. V4]WIW89470.1 CoA transferase [Sphingobium sp. V4]
MLGNKALPDFGCLRGVKVVHATSNIAGPFGAELLAEHGADVLWLENARSPDPSRLSGRRFFQTERQNQRTMALDLPSEQGREIFARIIREADIFIENSKGGQYEKWGLTDEVLWQINPRLIIAHLSGFGETGLKEYVERPSYDAIAQAFGGYIDLNSNGVTAPYAAPATADYVAGLFQVVGILAALHRVKQSGVGESVDVAMYECIMKVQCDQGNYFTDKEPVARVGYPYWVAGWTCLPCKDGEYIQLCLTGTGVLKKAIPFFGLEYGSAEFPEGISGMQIAKPNGRKFSDAIAAYLLTKTVDEAEKEMITAGLPVSKVNTLADIEHDPHVLARETLDEWEAFNGEKIKSVGPVPKFRNNPGRHWRAAPLFGMDNDEVLAELGYSAEEIAAFYTSRTIARQSEPRTRKRSIEV